MKTLAHKEIEPKLPFTCRLLVSVPPIRVAGTYSTETDTWSNRLFEDAAIKKHNEDM